MRVNFGVRLPVSGPLASPSSILKVGQSADELGFNSITTHDHVSFNHEERYHNSGGTAEAVDELYQQGLPVTNNYETMTTLSVLAGKTSNVRLIPCAAVLPWRHPVLFAKQAATLQELSGGRFVFNVCIGSIESDFKAMGVNFKLRGKIMDEYLEAVRLVLGESKSPGFQGRFLSFPPSQFYPKTKTPFWISGHFNERAFGRVVKYADGYLAGSSYPAAFREWLPKLRQLLESEGRSLEDIEVGVQTFLCMMEDGEDAKRRSKYTIQSYFSGPEFDGPDPNDPSKTKRDVRMQGTLKSSLVGSPTQVIEKIGAYSDAGVRFFDIRLVNSTVEDILLMLRLFSRDVMPSFS